MSVHKKLMQARIKLQGTKLTKTGQNKFAGYKYFELSDFLPTVQEIFNELGLAGVVSYHADAATLTIVDTESSTELVITSPMASANLKGAHDIQNLGAVQTYLRRYLWVTAMEIVEHDILDATLGASDSKPKPKPTAPLPTNQPTDAPWAISITSEDEWAKSVVFAASELLKFAKSKTDVVEIFKVNRKIFDRLMVEDKTAYDELMAVFSEFKSKLGE